MHRVLNRTLWLLFWRFWRLRKWKKCISKVRKIEIRHKPKPRKNSSSKAANFYGKQGVSKKYVPYSTKNKIVLSISVLDEKIYLYFLLSEPNYFIQFKMRYPVHEVVLYLLQRDYGPIFLQKNQTKTHIKPHFY